ncbi:MAG: M3 family oligoendopeptidase [Chloroflexota bacterium]|nr:M3 family oligoendopeptidase [Chloroflexota bacterium]
MTVVYPSLESPEFATGFEEVIRQIDDLVQLFDAHDVGQRVAAPLDDGTVTTFEEVTNQLNRLLERIETLNAYIAAFVTTDSRNSLAQAKASELQQRQVKVAQLGTRYAAWIGSLDLPALIERSTMAREHAFPLEQLQVQAQHLMSPQEEALAAELRPSGGSAWSRLQGDVSSQLEVPLEVEDEPRLLPMSAVRNLAHDPDRAVRRRAYEAELAAWERAALPLAAAMNGIKGEVNTLAARRGWASPLDAALFDSRIDRTTLDVMLGAAEEAFPTFRRYLRAKARVLGVSALAWYDLFAPVGEDAAAAKRWDFATGSAFIVDRFGAYSPKLAQFAERAFRERWIDAEPRPGKRDGAFCMSLRGDESRILANYQSSYDAVSTLAHELGHGYHNLCEAGLTPLQRETPMTLAETASIFCETIVREAAMAQTDEQGQFAILEASLQNSCQIVVDIASRFRFEERVFGARRARNLAVEELNELMLGAQRETYGDGLDAEALHPYMWAVKSHYYSPGRSFYNYPYMFGLLFGLGLYAHYREEPEGFRRGYDDLLASTGRADAATLAARFGIDIQTRDFWRTSLDMIRLDVDRFETLVARSVPEG